jgi:hypothetical protein
MVSAPRSQAHETVLISPVQGLEGLSGPPCFPPVTPGRRKVCLPCGQGRRRWHQAFAGDAPFRPRTCISFLVLRIGKVAQDVSARASSGWLVPKKNIQNQLRSLGCLPLRKTAVNSHRVQATQNDSRNRSNIATRLAHRQPHLAASQGKARPYCRTACAASTLWVFHSKVISLSCR